DDARQAEQRPARHGRRGVRPVHQALRAGAHLLRHDAMSGDTPDRHATLEIKNRLGLHARAAVLLVQTANRFEAEVAISKDGQSVNGRSIMGIMMLAAGQGRTIDATTSEPQAGEALEAIRELVEAGFHETS